MRPISSQASDRSSLLIDEEPELDRLYLAPREEFIKLRDDLAGRLREEGDQEAATRVKQLKKPTVSAWLVNQLGRTRQVDAQRLTKAGEALEHAQQEALAGGDPRGFEAARREEGIALRLLRAAAVEILPSASAATLDRVVTTLRAAAATPEGRLLLRQGRLAEDLEPPGFEALSGGMALKPEKRGARPADGGERRRQGKIDALRRRKQEADANAAHLADEARQLEGGAKEAAVQASRAARAAAGARQRADAAAEKARSIQTELAELEVGDRDAGQAVRPRRAPLGSRN
jgi:hypothetical protein